MHREAPSTVPVHFIIALFVLPLFWRKVKLGRDFKWIIRRYWSRLAKVLRLSSYFYGVRFEHEEQAGPLEEKILNLHRKWLTFQRAITRSSAPLPPYTGRQMRVPYADSVALVKPRRNVFIEVDDKGVPVTDEGKISAVLQERVGIKANRDVRSDYTQVFLPPLYHLRFWIFGALLWTAVSWTCVMALLLPIAVGRQLTGLYYGYQVHDGISFVSWLDNGSGFND